MSYLRELWRHVGAWLQLATLLLSATGRPSALCKQVRGTAQTPAAASLQVGMRTAILVYCLIQVSVHVLACAMSQHIRFPVANRLVLRHTPAACNAVLCSQSTADVPQLPSCQLI